MEFHPYSEVFPLIDGLALDELVADIKAFGLREKIWLYEEQILDGRNRFLACQKAGVAPEYRQFQGTPEGALAHVISLNVQRRHLTESQRAMAAAKIATLRSGSNQHLPKNTGSNGQGVPIGTTSQMLNVSERSVKRARKVQERGSKALNQAVISGEVSVSRAAAVTNLPKSEQLKAATHPDEPERPDDVDEDAVLAAAEQEYLASAEKALGTDAATEIKRLSAELAVVKLTRDGYMNGKDAVTRMLKAEQRKVERLQKEIDRLREENDRLRERVAIMEQS